MALRIKTTWLLGGAVAALVLACAEGRGTDMERSPTVREPDEDASDEESVPEDEDAGDEPEDSGAPPPMDAGMDAGKDAGQADSGTMDSGAQPDAGRDSGAADSATPDAGRDAGPSGPPPPKPLPGGTREGDWTYVEVDGALCRDGSKAGYFHRKGDANLMIFLNGSGACTDDFFCSVSPRNVNESFAPESLLGAAPALLAGPGMTRQSPPNDGILRQDERNPVGTWSMIFVPYCTGDVHGGAKPKGTVPGVNGEQQFVGYTNVGLFLNSFGPSFTDTPRVLLAGTGAGGFGALLNLERVQDYFTPYGAKVTVLTDSGIPFRDMFLEPCLQKKWRDLWNLNGIMPKGCTGCLNADGGGLAQGLGTYLFKERFTDRMMGGVVSSPQDEIIRLFFSAGLNNCTLRPGDEVPWMVLGFGSSYPADRYPAGLRDVLTNVVGLDRAAHYILNNDTRHMHLWRSRFYQDNGLGQTLADWVRDVLAGKATHRGNL